MGKLDAKTAAFAALHARRSGGAHRREREVGRRRTVPRPRRAAHAVPGVGTGARPRPRARVPRLARRPGPAIRSYFVRVQPVASGMILRDLQAVMGPNLAGHPAAEDHRAGRRARGRRDPRVPRDRARAAGRRDHALPDPRERAARSATRTRSRSASRARRVHGRRGVAVRRHLRATSASAGRRRAPRRCSSARRCSSTPAPRASAIRSAACGAAPTTTSTGCGRGSPSSATSATSG